MAEAKAPLPPSELGYLRAAAAVPLCLPGRPDANAESIVQLSRAALSAGARLVVFPELSITGYTCADLFLQKRLEAAVADAVARLVAELPSEIVAVVGAPWRCEGGLFNTAIVLAGGQVVGIVPKSYLPNYKEFYEKRWFVSGLGSAASRTIVAGREVPFGTDLLFEIPGAPGAVLGIEICEDLWVPTPPSSLQALAGAQILANLSASDETIGKREYRRDALVAAHSARCLAGMVFVSSGPGESSSDLVFGGHILIAENGTILVEERSFPEAPALRATDLDVGRLIADRDRTGSFADAAAASGRTFRRVPAPAATPARETFTRPIEPHPFVPDDPSTLDARCEEVAAIQTAGLRRRMRHLARRRPIVGLSGGLDSALAALVAARALAAGGDPVLALLAVSMPGAGTSRRTRENAARLARALGAELREIDIREAVELHLRDLRHSGAADVAFENAQARERTQILMDLSNSEPGFVVGTGDLSEIALGWSTYGGDHLSMYDVNASVPKTLVRHVVSWFARNGEEELFAVLEDILATPVSPELLPAGPEGQMAQKSEDVLGPYELHDFFLYHFLRGGDRPAKLLFLARRAFEGRYDERTIVKTLRTFFERFFANQFKRNAMPDGPKVGTVALSPRGDWRMPADVTPETWLADLPEA